MINPTKTFHKWMIQFLRVVCFRGSPLVNSLENSRNQSILQTSGVFQRRREIERVSVSEKEWEREWERDRQTDRDRQRQRQRQRQRDRERDDRQTDRQTDRANMSSKSFARAKSRVPLKELSRLKFRRLSRFNTFQRIAGSLPKFLIIPVELMYFVMLKGPSQPVCIAHASAIL